MVYLLGALLVITFGISFYVIRNLIKKVETLEDLLFVQSDYFVKMKEMVDLSGEKLKELDVRGMFSSDDEVGFFFTYIKNFQQLLDEYVSKNIKTL